MLSLSVVPTGLVSVVSRCRPDCESPGSAAGCVPDGPPAGSTEHIINEELGINVNSTHIGDQAVPKSILIQINVELIFIISMY